MLNPKQTRFCQEYLIDHCGTQAAIRAGYSAKTANEQASQLLAKLHIQEYIAAREKKIADKLEITAERITAELAKCGFSDMKQFAKWGGDGVQLVESNALTPNSLRLCMKCPV